FFLVLRHAVARGCSANTKAKRALRMWRLLRPVHGSAHISSHEHVFTRSVRPPSAAAAALADVGPRNAHLCPLMRSARGTENSRRNPACTDGYEQRSLGQTRSPQRANRGRSSSSTVIGCRC